MKKMLDQLADRFNKLQLRERILVSVLTLVLLFMTFDFLFLTPTIKKRQMLLQQTIGQEKSLKMLNKQIEYIKKDSQGYADNPLMRKHVYLVTQKKSLEKKLSNLAEELISSQEMAEALKNLLRQDSSLHLLRVESISPQNEDEQNAQDTAPGKLFEHRLLIEFEGEYFNVLAYLRKVEQSKWHIFWDHIDYQVTNYPMARVKMLIHILSNQEALLRV